MNSDRHGWTLNYLVGGCWWWLVYPPAITLIITVVAFNLIGDTTPSATRLQRP